jgi:RNA polymerase sigma factor (sigma-70 family)
MAMNESPRVSHLSQIETHWTTLFQAHESPSGTTAAAQAALMLRYSGAVNRYLLKATGDPHIADDLAQDFAVRFLRGDFRRAEPCRGRFRDYVKMAASNLVRDHFRRCRTRPRMLEDDPALATAAHEPSEIDRTFIESWREAVMARAWDALAGREERTGTPFYTVLRFRADHPDLPSRRMAERLSDRLRRPVSAVWVRQMIFRAREQFVDRIIAEVACTLDAPTAEQLEQELIAIDLLSFCRSGLDRFPVS